MSTTDEQKEKARKTIKAFIEGAKQAVKHGMHSEYMEEFAEKFPILMDAIVALLPEEDQKLIAELYKWLKEVRSYV